MVLGAHELKTDGLPIVRRDTVGMAIAGVDVSTLE